MVDEWLGGKRGLVHVYTGDGKGKTTAALGLILRAMGWGARVCMVQFIKGYADIGEAKTAAESSGRFVLKQFAIDLSRDIGNKKALERKNAVNEAMDCARIAVDEGEFDLIVLDEVNNAMCLGLVAVEEVLDMLHRRPPGVEIVLTGRQAPQAVIDAADYVTEMRLIKHPYDSGTPARKGVDF